MEGMLSPADVAVLSGNTGNGANGMWGDNGAWWIILFLIFGWGRNGFGGNGGFNGGNDGCCGFQAPNIYGKLDGITYGISDATFALNNNITNGFAGVQQTLCQGFSGVNQAINTNGYETRFGISDLGYRLQDCCCKVQTQIADCCCATQRAIDGVNYNLATNTNAIQQTLCNNTRDIVENNNNNTRAILDFLTQDKISSLQAENQALKFQASQTAQNAFITANQDAQTAELIRRLGADCPVPAYVVQPSTPVTFPVNGCGQFVGYNTGCGCNNY